MHVTANCAILQRDEGWANEHAPQADAEEQTILVDALRPECGHMKRIGDERIGEDRYASFQMISRIFFDDNRHEYLCGS